MSRIKKGLSKKQQILNAAFDTICEYTISGTNLREIARRVGMSQGNLHYYYPAKEELLLDLLSLLLDNFIDERKKIIYDSTKKPFEKLALILNHDNMHIQKRKEMGVFLEFCIIGAKNAIIQKKFQETYNTWLSIIELFIDEGIKEGSFSSKHRDFIPDLFISIIDGAALRYHVNGKAFNLKTYFASVHTLISELLT